uniref:Uncharacterized protein n=1 Tax=Rhizophora mucronata TaxID=61149 RepID=A0A2P2PQC6_RHIMU
MVTFPAKPKQVHPSKVLKCAGPKREMCRKVDKKENNIKDFYNMV